MSLATMESILENARDKIAGRHDKLVMKIPTETKTLVDLSIVEPDGSPLRYHDV